MSIHPIPPFSQNNVTVSRSASLPGCLSASISKITRLFAVFIALSASPTSAYCAQQGAMCLVPTPSCKYLLPLGISTESPLPQPSTITLKQLQADYDIGSLIGNGDKGFIKQVTSRAQPDEQFAIKLSAQFTNLTIGIQLVPYLLNQEITPHLVRTYEAHNFTFAHSASVSARLKNMQLLRMELMHGDLSNFRRFSVEQRLAFALQQVSTLEMLGGKFDISHDPLNLGDLFYHKLTDRDCFRGQVMKEMDYWRYVVSGQVFYLPRQPNILKIGDYDSWKIPLSDKEPGRFKSDYYSIDELVDNLQLNALMTGIPKDSIRDLLQQWSTVPPSQDSFLDFDIICLENFYLGDRSSDPISI